MLLAILFLPATKKNLQTFLTPRPGFIFTYPAKYLDPGAYIYGTFAPLSMIDEQTLARLRAIPDSEWELIYKELVLFAIYKLTEMDFAIRTEPDVMLSEDLAQEAIKKVFEGTRAWNYERFPDILIHLKGVVKSLISSQAKKSSKAVVTQEGTSQAQDNDGASSTDESVEEDNPETLLIDQQFWRSIEAAFAGKDEDFLIFSEWFDLVPPRKIAEEYKKTSEEVYRIVKKGKKIVASIVKGE